MIEDKAKAMKHTKQLKKYRIRATKLSTNATKKNTIRQQNDDSKVTMCLVCGETYQEAWIQCGRCKLWAHEDCADITDSLYYFSDNCKDVSLQNKRRKAVRCQTITKTKRSLGCVIWTTWSKLHKMLCNLDHFCNSFSLYYLITTSKTARFFL